MIQFYIVAWFFFRLMKNRKLPSWILGAVISFAISWAGTFITHNLIGKTIIGKLFDQTIVKYFWLFYIGSFVAEFKDILLPILQKYWFGLLFLAFFFFWTGWNLYSGYYLLWSVFLTVGLIGFAYKFPQLNISPDISYGLFLYHMTVINIFVNFKETLNK